MNRVKRPFAVIVTALVLLTSACSGSGSESGNLVPVNASAPGVLYVSTDAGGLQAVSPSSGEPSIVTVGDDAAPAVVDVAPARGATGLYALVRVPAQTFMTEVVDVTQSGFEPIETEADTLSCLDPHTGASIALAHETAAGDANGAQFTPVVLAGGTLDADFDLVSVACPRWSGERDMVAAAIPTRASDPSSIVTIVQSAAGEQYEIGFTGCGTTPTSFSPDDRFLAVSLTCYAAAWQNSGLYLLPVDELAVLGDPSDLTKLGDGLYGRTAWHPDGEWIAAVHADAIEKQNIAMDLGAQPVGLQAIELATLQTIDIDLADGAAPFAIAWLEAPITN